MWFSSSPQQFGTDADPNSPPISCTIFPSRAAVLSPLIQGSHTQTHTVVFPSWLHLFQTLKNPTGSWVYSLFHWLPSLQTVPHQAGRSQQRDGSVTTPNTRHTHAHKSRRPVKFAGEEGGGGLLAFKMQKVLMPAIDWYLSSVRWSECMHNHNYGWVRSLISIPFIFVDAFHLYSLGLWKKEKKKNRRLPFTLQRSDEEFYCLSLIFLYICLSVRTPTTLSAVSQGS